MLLQGSGGDWPATTFATCLFWCAIENANGSLGKRAANGAIAEDPDASLSATECVADSAASRP